MTSPNSAERAELALIDTGAESVTADPAAGDGAAVAQDASEPIRGRDRPLWWKIRREAPPPPEPHPAPLEPMEAGPWVEKTRARGWSTLPTRLGPGWELRSGRAVGWEIMARKRGALFESVSVQARHEPTGARAVAILRRPYPDGGKWAFKAPALVWVERNSRVERVGARVYTKAITGAPPLTADGRAWDVEDESTDEEES
jgi:hypothetical protein